MKKRIFSGITPSGLKLHIGNYFGAVLPQVMYQESNDYETIYFVSDLHALTTVKSKELLESYIRNVILDYLALGVNPDKSIFFRQSDVYEHSLLAIILQNYISYSHMQRMHAYKDKLSKKDAEGINMGLFNYPILMAADILLYNPYGIPVGSDQKQHIELTRDIAMAFNKTYKKEIFSLPTPIINDETGRIIGTDGKRKMSKSLGNVIGIFEDDNIIKRQINSCYTDPDRIKSSDKGKIEGNTVFIYHDLLNDNLEEVKDLKERYKNGLVGDVEVKEKLYFAHNKFFKKFKEKRLELENNNNLVDEILNCGAIKAREIAKLTIEKVYATIGL